MYIYDLTLFTHNSDVIGTARTDEYNTVCTGDYLTSTRKFNNIQFSKLVTDAIDDLVNENTEVTVGALVNRLINHYGFDVLNIQARCDTHQNKSFSEATRKFVNNPGKELKCEVCGATSHNLAQVCYYDISGLACRTEQDIENDLQNPDALTYILCKECAEKFNFRGDNSDD